MNQRPASPAPEWIAPRRPAASRASQEWPTRDDVDDRWHPLHQSWRTSPEPAFQPGWARVQWTADALHVEALFCGVHQTNQARGLNARTWELGSIFEFFLRATGVPRYLELHVTPENERLQLLWPEHGLADFRAGHARLEDFTIADHDWVTSEVRRHADHWCVRVILPLQRLGLDGTQPLPALHACVCRYDCGSGAEVLSSTAPLREPNYHRLAEWSRLRLVE